MRGGGACAPRGRRVRKRGKKRPAGVRAPSVSFPRSLCPPTARRAAVALATKIKAKIVSFHWIVTDKSTVDDRCFRWKRRFTKLCFDCRVFLCHFPLCCETLSGLGDLFSISFRECKFLKEDCRLAECITALSVSLLVIVVFNFLCAFFSPSLPLQSFSRGAFQWGP